MTTVEFTCPVCEKRSESKWPQTGFTIRCSECDALFDVLYRFRQSLQDTLDSKKALA